MSTNLPLGQFRFNWGLLLGEGGLGRVDEIIITDTNCTGIALGQHLACKRLNANFKDEPTARARFDREIEALKAMTHTDIVAYRGENLPDGAERFYVMPLYAQNLRLPLAGAPSGWEWKWVAMFCARLADALAYAHARGFIHRDLKPENILLDAAFNPVIADWGLGYFVHQYSKVLQHLTRGGMGTKYYCSMEQWATGKCDATGDIYSLGLVLAELLTGRQFPIQIVGMGIQADVLVAGTASASAINALVKSMTHYLPQHRPQSMALVAHALRRAIAAAAA